MSHCRGGSWGGGGGGRGLLASLPALTRAMRSGRADKEDKTNIPLLLGFFPPSFSEGWLTTEKQSTWQRVFFFFFFSSLTSCISPLIHSSRLSEREWHRLSAVLEPPKWSSVGEFILLCACAVNNRETRLLWKRWIIRRTFSRTFKKFMIRSKKAGVLEWNAALQTMVAHVVVFRRVVWSQFSDVRMKPWSDPSVFRAAGKTCCWHNVAAWMWFYAQYKSVKTPLTSVLYMNS